MVDKNHSTVTGFFKNSKAWFKEFLDEKVFFLQVTIILTCFQYEKSQNKLDLMQSFLLKRFTKLVKLNFGGCEAKTSHLSNFPFSFYLNLYQSIILHLVKTFRIKNCKKNIKSATKACSHERIISSDLKPEVDASLNITCRKVMITYCLTKSYLFSFFVSTGSYATRQWTRSP